MASNEVISLTGLQAAINATKAAATKALEAEEAAKVATAALGGNIFVVSEDETSVRISSVEPASQFEEKTVQSGGIYLQIVTITV